MATKDGIKEGLWYLAGIVWHVVAWFLGIVFIMFVFWLLSSVICGKPIIFTNFLWLVYKVFSF